MPREPQRIKAVLLDWAGTTIDHGSRAPTQVFLEIFRSRGIEITPEEARGPMGRAKWDHIAEVLALPRVAALWQARTGRAATQADVMAMYEEFLPLQKRVLERGSQMIPGVAAAISTLRERGIKIGSTTGYTRELMEVVAPAAAAQGYAPDAIICADDVPAGRPAPWMNFLAAQRLGVYPMSSVVVVDDTPVGIEAGLNAGAITVAVVQTGNELGLSAEDVRGMSSHELTERIAPIEAMFNRIGAHHTLRSAADLPALITKLT